MFVVMKMQDFEMEFAPNQPFKIPLPIVVEKGRMIGYLPVYNTKEDALSDFPNAKLAEVAETK